MEEQSSGSKQVSDSINNLNDITQKVKTSSTDISNLSQSILDETSNLNKITGEITTAINEIASGSETN